MKQYKVLSQKDRFFSKKFDPQVVEAALNSLAEEGWELQAVATATIPGFGGNREELMMIMERTVDA